MQANSTFPKTFMQGGDSRAHVLRNCLGKIVRANPTCCLQYVVSPITIELAASCASQMPRP